MTRKLTQQLDALAARVAALEAARSWPVELDGYDLPAVPSDPSSVTRAELDEIADQYGVDTTGARTKADVHAALVKALT